MDVWYWNLTHLITLYKFRPLFASYSHLFYLLPHAFLRINWDIIAFLHLYDFWLGNLRSNLGFIDNGHINNWIPFIRFLLNRLQFLLDLRCLWLIIRNLIQAIIPRLFFLFLLRQVRSGGWGPMTRRWNALVESSGWHDLADLRQSILPLVLLPFLGPMPHLLIELIQDISEIGMLMSMQCLSIGVIISLSGRNIDGTMSKVGLSQVILSSELKYFKTTFDLDV